MGFTSSIGALLGGAANEAAQIHAERFQAEQANKKLAFDTLTHLIDDPNIGNPAIKEEALQELQGRWMEQLHPDNYSHKAGKLGKLVDQFVGMQTPPRGPLGHPIQSAAPAGASQPGVGRGNATTQVGAAQPQGGPLPPPVEQAGSQALQMQPDAAQGPGSPPQPPWWNQTTASGFSGPGVAQSSALNTYQQQLNMQAAQKHDETQTTAPFDIGPLKKGDKIDATWIPVIDANIRNQMPEIDKNVVKREDGTEEVVYSNKKDGSVMWKLPLGQAVESARGSKQWYINRVEAQKLASTGQTLTTKEIMDAGVEYEKEMSKATSSTRLPFQEELANFKGNIQQGLGEARTARAEVAKAFDPYRAGVMRYNIMNDSYTRVKSGKATAIGAEDMILLSNHLAMSYGDIPGARTGRDILEAHANALSTPERIRKIIHQVLDGGQLTENQRQEFLEAAKQRVSELNDSFDRTKKLWDYEPPGGDKFFQVDQPGGGPKAGDLSKDAYEKWKAAQPKAK